MIIILAKTKTRLMTNDGSLLFCSGCLWRGSIAICLRGVKGNFRNSVHESNLGAYSRLLIELALTECYTEFITVRIMLGVTAVVVLNVGWITLRYSVLVVRVIL
ncbi:hypothetical protein TNIN_293321 [Trichonephila inaurata madagascariensis]|uniref:Uncharacterized protein n=1 Tax=Trichonephila inaurata madagascariensis TaxID=2747483 RepID=A0A8X6WVA2_9ARAC|nr:hypothetical protein TNIN_293321 [Trichonephila inaurata madagascariensis]